MGRSRPQDPLSQTDGGALEEMKESQDPGSDDEPEAPAPARIHLRRAAWFPPPPKKQAKPRR